MGIKENQTLPPIGLAVARFIRFYGFDTYSNPTWRTRCGTIPWRLFWYLYAQITRVQAMERVETALGVSTGRNLSVAGKDGKVKLGWQALLRRAYPEEFGPLE